MLTPETDISIYRAGYFEKWLSIIPLGIGDRIGSLFFHGGLRSKAIRGTAWTLMGFGSSQVLRLASNLILTRLLFPEDFGLMALVNVFLQGLEMMTDIGVNASIIQNKRGDEIDFLRTAWTVQVIRSALLWLGACAIAWPAAWFYEEPQLVYMIPVSGLAVLALGFQTTAMPQHSRQMKLGRVTLLQLIAQLINLSVTIVLAWQLHNVWALVWGTVSGAVVQIALAHLTLSGIKHRFKIDPASVREIVHFGKWIFFATALGFLAGHASDKLVLGKFVDKGMLGIYTIAFMLAQMPLTIINTLMERVLYPALSQGARENGTQFKQKLYKARSVIWPPFLLLVATLGFFSPYLFRTLWSPTYQAAGWMAQLLLLGVWFGGLSSSLNVALLAKGDGIASAIQNAIMLLLGVPGMMLGYLNGGVPGLIIGMVTGKVVAHIVMHTMLARRGVSLWRQDLIAHLCMMVVAMFIALSCGLDLWGESRKVFSIGSVADGDRPAIAIAVVVLGLLLINCFKPFMRKSLNGQHQKYTTNEAH